MEARTMQVQAESRIALKEDAQNPTSIETNTSRGAGQQQREGPFLQVHLSWNETSRRREQ